jgi:hypothetical protein
MELIEAPKSLYTVMHGMVIVYSGRWMLVGKKTVGKDCLWGKSILLPRTIHFVHLTPLNKILTQFTTPNNSS